MITLNGDLSPESTRAEITESAGAYITDARDAVFEAVLTGNSITGEISGGGTLTGQITLGGSASAYQGDYEITPSDTVQILETKDLMMLDNITVNPVPSNYGLITWDGTTLLVS